MSIKKIGLSALVMSSTLIAGCGSDSNDSSNSYLTYFNLSPNKASVLLYDDDTLISTVGYESTSSLKTIESGSSTIELKVSVDEDTNETLYQEDINLGKDKFNYLISFNDLGDESAENQPVLFTFDNKSGDIDEDTFEFNLMHLAPDINGSLDSEDLDSQKITVEFVSTEDYAAAVNDGNDDDNDYTVLESFEIDFKEKKTLTIDDEAEKYYIILKNSKDEQILRTGSISFNESQYFFALKDSKLNDTQIPSLARIFNSSVATLEYRDTELESYFRIYNSADTLGDVSLKLNGEATAVNSVAGDTLSLFETLAPENAGEYNVTLQHDNCSEDEAAKFEDKCRSSTYPFRNGEDKTIVYFRGEPNDNGETELDNIAFPNTNRDITDNHQITFVNLLNNQGDNAVDFYFVKKGEFIDNGAYSLIQRELGDINRFVIPSGTYDIYLTYDNEYDVPVTLAKEFNVEFGSDEGDQLGDWIIFAEPASDVEGVDPTASGRDAVLNRVPMNDANAEASKAN